MKNIVYVSTAVKLFEEEYLIRILQTSREYNTRHHISGVLLYAQGTFIQVLEGEDEEVDRIYATIINDPRHKNIIKLINSTLAERNFTEWAMGFCPIATETATELLGYLQLPGNWINSGNSAAITTVKSFIETNQLNISY